jgi:hypothetical protein
VQEGGGTWLACSWHPLEVVGACTRGSSLAGLPDRQEGGHSGPGWSLKAYMLASRAVAQVVLLRTRESPANLSSE